MGGKAIKGHETVRLAGDEYFAFQAQTLQTLRRLFPGKRVEAIEAYRSKPDFGDLDILLESDGYDPFKAAEALGSVETVRNGPVTSIGIVVPDRPTAGASPVFQVDLIRMEKEAFDYALAYFSFNDLGNLIGRTAHKGGTSHGHDGLWYYFRDGDYMFREILLTRDHDAALTYLGYEPARFKQGFEDLEEIFQYVAGSRYFNRDIHLLAQSRDVLQAELLELKSTLGL
jgi:hypothetical protein